MYFVCGIHGVGKSTFVKELGNCLGVSCYSASMLIKSETQDVISEYKKVNNVSENQDLLLSAISKIQQDSYILEGHLCLVNKQNKIEKIPFNVFNQMEIEGLYILIEKPLEIKKRLKNRDNRKWDIRFIEAFQKEEYEYANELSKMLCVPLKIVYGNKEIEDYPYNCKDSIIIPIKPIFADKILNGEKKYEFRKKLCKKEINKIYIYATSPVKMIIGEAEVEQKLSMKKEKLWLLTQEDSGISKDYYDNYFEKQEYACAYQLGKIKRYEEPVTLESMGIEYAPQSFIYY